MTIAAFEKVDMEIWKGVQTAFAEALGFDEEEIFWEQTIIGELGAESLDFLDIAFRLERRFSIRIPRGGIEDAVREGVGEDVYEEDGVLTPLGIACLQKALPEIPASEFVPNLRSSEVPELFRVATFYNLVVQLLDQRDPVLCAS